MTREPAEETLEQIVQLKELTNPDKEKFPTPREIVEKMNITSEKLRYLLKASGVSYLQMKRYHHAQKELSEFELDGGGILEYE